MSLNFIVAMTIAIAFFSVAAAQGGKLCLVISSVGKSGEIQDAQHISHAPFAPGRKRILWQELPMRPWAPPFPLGSEGGFLGEREALIIADREYPEIGLSLERLDPEPAAQAKGTIAVRYSARGALGADGYSSPAMDEAGIRAISIEGEIEVLFDAETRLPLAAKYDWTRDVSPALWREGAALHGLADRATVAWSILP